MKNVFQGVQPATRYSWWRSLERSVSEEKVEKMGTPENTVETEYAHSVTGIRVSEKQSEHSGPILLTMSEQSCF